MIVKVQNPKNVYIDQFCVHWPSEDKNNLNGKWVVSCLNPKYDPDPGENDLRICENEDERLRYTKRLYFHSDGRWRTLCINEAGEYTAYFESKPKLLQMLRDRKISKPIEFKSIIERINYEAGFPPGWVSPREQEQIDEFRKTL